MLRCLVDAIVLTPGQDGDVLQIKQRGDPAAMIGATVQTNRSSESDDLSLQVSFGGFESASGWFVSLTSAPEGSLPPSTLANAHGAQAGSRAAQPPSVARRPLTPPSTVVE